MAGQSAEIGFLLSDISNSVKIETDSNERKFLEDRQDYDSFLLYFLNFLKRTTYKFFPMNTQKRFIFSSIIQNESTQDRGELKVGAAICRVRKFC